MNKREGRARPSRRHVLCAAAASLAIIPLLAACSSGGAALKAGPTSNRAITIVEPTEPVSLDPCDTQLQDTGYILIGNVLQGLTALDPNTGKTIPQLATSWKQDSSTEWTFTLKKGVKFSDGSPFNAAAAAYNINRLVNGTSDAIKTCANLSNWAGETVKTTIVNSNTLNIVTSVVDPLLPTRLVWTEMSSPTATPTDKKTQDPIGTGPFKLQKYAPTQNLILERYTGYSGPAPEVQKATYIWRSDTSVAADMVKTSEADMALGLAPQDVGTNAESYPLSESAFLRLDTDIAPLNDVRVREAIALSIDRKTIVKSLMQKIGTVSQQLVAKTVNGFIPNYSGVPFDPAKAKQLVSEAKADGVNVNTTIPVDNRTDLFPGEDQVIQAIVADVNKSGLRLQQENLDLTAWTVQNSRPFPANRPARIIVSATNNNTPDASFNFLTYMVPDQRHSVLNDPTVTNLLNEANAAPVGAKRASLFQQAANTVYSTDYYLIPYAYLYGLLETSPRIHYTTNAGTSTAVELADITFTNK